MIPIIASAGSCLFRAAVAAIAAKGIQAAASHVPGLTAHGPSGAPLDAPVTWWTQSGSIDYRAVLKSGAEITAALDIREGKVQAFHAFATWERATDGWTETKAPSDATAGAVGEWITTAQAMWTSLEPVIARLADYIAR